MGRNRVSNAEYTYVISVLSVGISFTFLPFYFFTFKLFRVRQHFSLKIRNKVVNKKYCLPPPKCHNSKMRQASPLLPIIPQNLQKYV